MFQNIYQYMLIALNIYHSIFNSVFFFNGWKYTLYVIRYKCRYYFQMTVFCPQCDKNASKYVSYA